MEPAPFHQLPGDPLRPADAWWLTAEDGVRLRIAHWRSQTEPRGSVLLLPGRTEYVEKYARIARTLTDAGYDVLSIDWRGQGMSARLQDNPRPGHVREFADYQLDLLEMIVAATELDLPRPWHLLSHSMGGCIALAGLHADLPVQSAVFSAPMWGINLRQMPQGVAVGMAYLAGRLGRGGNAAPGSGSAGTYLLDEAFSANLLTHDADQWAIMLREASAWPHMTIGGASYNWVGKALNECVRLSRLPSPNIPTLVTLGDEERIVSTAAIRDRLTRWPEAELLEMAGVRHEVMMCTPENRARFIDAALMHFEDHA
ncbi:alpha/beta hydrolase [Paracoccus caeni]|uniref:Alpha/beta hydrolase n=1 Tax=Paracoccus caeni TaxID=657651 RepID=A0A934VY50_9RHOB|nr:alpha/beta hydrolase [Paracoccus caeni]MBK4215627.1 alpha/beta hydrolase [Paracoccus caeni]